MLYYYHLQCWKGKLEVVRYPEPTATRMKIMLRLNQPKIYVDKPYAEDLQFILTRNAKEGTGITS